MLYYVIDTETTGLPVTDKADNADFNNVRLLEIAVLRCKNHTPDTKAIHTHPGFASLIDPGQPIPPEVTAINRITAGMIDPNEHGLEKVGGELCEWIETVRADMVQEQDRRGIVHREEVWVGQNIVAFDLPLIAQEFDRAQVPGPFDMHHQTYVIHDTKLIWNAWTLGMRRGENEHPMHFYGRVAAQRVRGKSSLGWLVQTLLGAKGKEEAAREGGLHRATGDCVVTHLVYEAMRERGIIEEVMG